MKFLYPPLGGTTSHTSGHVIVIFISSLLAWIPAIFAQDPGCPVGRFGDNCSQECHCLNGVSVCKALNLEPDGNLTVICEDYQCDLGWTNPPICQEICEEGRFSRNCELECHCPPGIACNRITGECYPDPACHPEWTGAGCQKRRPKLVNAPQLDVSCTSGQSSSVLVSWRQWTILTDIGDEPVGTYDVEYRVNGSAWQRQVRLQYDPIRNTYDYLFVNAEPYSFYQFRITANRVANDKLDPGLPSPLSRTVRPCFDDGFTPVPPFTDSPPFGSSTPGGGISPRPSPTPSPGPTPPPSAPSSPNNVTISQGNFGRVFVHWKPPSVTGGGLTGYRVIVQQIGIGDCDRTTTGTPVTYLADANAESFELTNLKRFTRYRVIVNAVNRLGEGPRVSREFVSPETQPTGTVTNVGHTNITATSVVVTWDPVPCEQRGGALLQYDILIRDVNSDAVILGSAKPNTSFSAINLKPFTTYSIAVRYTNRIGAGPYSPEYQVHTAQIRPQEVRNITVSVDQSGRVFVHWNIPPDVSGPLNGYNITYQKIGTGNCEDQNGPPGPIKSGQVSSLTTSVALEGLELWSRYRITVRAINDAGAGVISETTFVTPQIRPNGTVASVNHTELMANSVTFFWDPVPCLLRGGEPGFYDVVVRDVQARMTVASERITDSAFKIIDLTPYTEYGITVRYGNRVGIGPRSKEYIVRSSLAAPPTPRNIRLVALNQTAFQISWDSPNPSHGQILEYRVSYFEPETPEKRETVTVAASGGPQQSLVVGGLPAATTVNVGVEARTAAGWGDISSPPLVITTEDGIPSAPTQLRITGRNETCVSLQWQQPEQLNGQLAGYRISYRPLSINSVSNSDPTPIDKDVPASVNFYYACQLQPASQYIFNLVARTRSGYGLDVETRVYTFIGIVEAPPRPVIAEVGRTTITINVRPAAITGGPIAAYFIVVNRVGASSRKKRVLPDPVTALRLPGYTTARLEPFQVRTGIVQFIIGDNQTFGGYRNAPLSPETTYSIQYVVGSEVGDVPAKLASASANETATTLAGEGQNGRSITDLLAIILPIIFGLLLLLLLAFLIWWFCCRKKQPEDETKLNGSSNIWDIYNLYYNTKDKKGLWSDIQDLNDPRHVTIYEDKSYDPENLRVTAIQEGKHNISFAEEYNKLRPGIQFSTTVAKRPENANKNRIDNMIPYDQNRVKLRRKGRSDYINASYINSYMNDKAYIAASSPFNDLTVDDFWFMIYQEKVNAIVFLNRLQEDTVLKSVEYWPEDQNTAKFNTINVAHQITDYYANFIIRTFLIYKSRQGHESGRQITQFQFVAWPDHGVPSDPIPFLDFHMKVRTSINAPDHQGPLLVHCGTGVSRTAVFIAVDALLEQADLENAVNVFKFVDKMRQNRPHMVRTLKQYRFIYDVLFEGLITNYNIVGDDLKVNYRLLSRTNPVTDRSYFREQFEVLEEFVPPLTPQKTSAALLKQNKEKNRFETILPPDEHRVILRSPGGLGRTDYINALFVDGYVKQKEFIVTQTPLPSTVIDFWKMIWDYNVHVIVMLNGRDYREDTCAQYWPARVGSEKYDPFIVHLRNTVEEDYVTIRSMTLTSAAKPNAPPRQIQQFQFEAWHMYEKVPWSREGFIQLIEQVELYREHTDSMHTPIVVHCCDGANQSGLFCACAVLFEKMVLEGEVDVFHTIKHLKRRRPHFINSLDQYKYSFKLLWDYLNVKIKGLSPSESDGPRMNGTPSGASSSHRIIHDTF